MNEANHNAEAIEADAAQWLAREDGDGWHADLQAERDAWLRDNVRHRVAYLRLRAAWQRADAVAGQAIERPAPSRPLARFSRWRMAAGLLLACGLGAFLAPDVGWQQGQRYATGTGENRTIALADGSRLMLNTATRLRTAPDGGRHVWLDSGEAYFDIAHDPSRPFVVEAGTSRVTVLGTRFTVRRDGERTRVLVEQGRVQVDERDASVVLTPNQEARSAAGHIARAEHSQVQTGQRLAWREGRIVFDQITLGEAIAEFNRYNDRKLVITDPEAASLRIGGSFAPSNIDGFVRLLEQGFGLQAERGTSQIVISR